VTLTSLRWAASVCIVFVTACGSEDEPVVDPKADAADWGAITETEIPVGDFVFDARAAGPADGELVLLLHGFPETSYEWRHQLRALGEAGYRAVAPDQRGYSPRARPDGVDAYGIILLVQDALAIVDALGVDRFHVVGHDWGAAVAWGVAKVAAPRVISANPVSVPHPDAFRRVLADPTSCQPAASSYFDQFVMPGYEDTLLANDAALLRVLWTGIPEDAVNEYFGALGEKPALSAALNWYRANIENRMPKGPELGKITVPTQFIWSDADIALCRDGAELTGEYIDAPYRFEVLTGVSHWVPELAAEQTNALLLEHLDGF
jgi:pimeloyl-ACP methyl ester carboxylesterase